MVSFLLGFVMTRGFFVFQSTNKGIQTYDNSFKFSQDDSLNSKSVYLRHLNSLQQTNGRNKKDGRWYGVKDPFEFYAYSAFYDDRRSLGTLPVIRMVAVSEYLDKRTIHCLFYYKDRSKGHLAQASTLAIGAGLSRHGKGFREYIITCPLDSEDVPTNVSVALTMHKKPDWFLPVEVPETPPEKVEFITCVSVTYWNHNPYQIVEWMELLNELGVSKVVIYNNSLSAEASRVFQYYDSIGFVDFRQSWNFVPDPGEVTIHMHMSPVINDCIYRNMYSTKKIVVTDLDELIIPQNKYNYHEMLKEIDEKQEGTTHPARQYMFRNAYFFFDIPHVDESAPKHLKTLRHKWRLPPSAYGYSTKSIISPLACTNMHNHYCWGSTKLYDTNGYSVDAQPKYALNQHYKKCHLDKWERPGACKEQMNHKAVSDDVMLRYKDRLISRVNARLKLLKLDPL